MMQQADFAKYPDGLIPTIIQDAESNKVLMLGFMNAEALEKTRKDGKVTFFSRSKQRLWIKGETTGHFLYVKDMMLDCDQDTILIKAVPAGPVCHTGADTCFDETNQNDDFIQHLEQVIAQRAKGDQPESYTYKLLTGDVSRIAQKVGEEGLEVALEAMKTDQPKLIDEAADLIYHLLVLLHRHGKSYNDVIQKLKERHKV
ncbi:MAG: bifunctional phosphoribosyl-AMP cyclohydrolase/phosphoribosyl-ATP diphosphatase HisIE [Flavobacteriales bacterium]